MNVQLKRIPTLFIIMFPIEIWTFQNRHHFQTHSKYPLKLKHPGAYPNEISRFGWLNTISHHLSCLLFTYIAGHIPLYIYIFIYSFILTYIQLYPYIYIIHSLIFIYIKLYSFTLLVHIHLYSIVKINVWSLNPIVDS